MHLTLALIEMVLAQMALDLGFIGFRVLGSWVEAHIIITEKLRKLCETMAE